MDKKGLQRSAFLAFFWIVILAVSLTTATYAWFTISAVTNVEPMSSAASAGDVNLVIANAKEGPFDKECQLRLTGNPEVLSPVSTSGLETFFEATVQNRQGISYLYKDVTKEIDTKLLHGTVYLRSEYRDCDVYLRRSGLDLGTDGQILAAMRLGLKITSKTGTTTRIFKLDQLGNTQNAASTVTTAERDTVVSGVTAQGRGAFVKDPSLNIADYLADEEGQDDPQPKAGREVLVHLDADETATVEFWLYMEGCDENCINEAQKKDTGLSLSFAGVPREEQ